MRGGTHALAGVLIGAALTIDSVSLIPIVGAIAAGALGALAPDLDHPQAALSRKILTLTILKRPCRVRSGRSPCPSDS